LRPQIGIERGVASAGMHAALAERAVEEEQPTGDQDARGTGKQPFGGGPGAIWTMLIATMASALATGQVSAAASSGSGGNTFGRPILSRQAAMLLNASGS
jgi:hypothetical protein